MTAAARRVKAGSECPKCRGQMAKTALRACFGLVRLQPHKDFIDRQLLVESGSKVTPKSRDAVDDYLTGVKLKDKAVTSHIIVIPTWPAI